MFPSRGRSNIVTRCSVRTKRSISIVGVFTAKVFKCKGSIVGSIIWHIESELSAAHFEIIRIKSLLSSRFQATGVVVNFNSVFK